MYLEKEILEIIQALAAFAIGLIVVEAMVPMSRRWLPLGGSHIAQLGILFALLLVALDVGPLLWRLLSAFFA